MQNLQNNDGVQDGRSNLVRVVRHCGDCGDEFESMPFMGYEFGKYCSPCKDKRRRLIEVEQSEIRVRSLEYRRQEWIADPVRGIPRRYRDLDWEDFKYDKGGEGNREKVALFREYANTFPVEGMPYGIRSLLLARDLNGVGKTMLAGLIDKTIIYRYEETGRERCPFQFWTVDDVKLRLKSAERYGGTETPEDVYRDFGTMWLLVLDDVGKEKMEGADLGCTYELYFNILNRRYNNQLPVILTSNLMFEPWVPGGPTLTDLMGRAGVSRLMEMTEGIAYIIEGEDRR